MGAPTGTEDVALGIVAHWSWRDLDPRRWFRHTPLDADAAAKLKSEQFSAVLRHTPALMLANVCNALVFVAAFWGSARFFDALLWAGAVFAIAGYVYVRRVRRSRRKASASFWTGENRAVVNALALGSCWAALPLLFFQDASAGAQLLIACLSAGMLCGGAFGLASIPAAAISFAGPIFVGSLAALVRAGDKDHLLIGVVLVVYTSVLLKGVLAHADQLRTRVLMQMETEERARARMHKLQASGLNAIGGMATGVAHEINQPLSAAANYLEAARRSLRNAAQSPSASTEQALDKAAEQVAQVKEIVGHLREFLLRGEPAKSPSKLHDIIRQASDSTRAGASAANVQVELRLDAECDAVMADKVQIRQVLTNLIRNAIEAMDASAERELTIVTSTDASGGIRTDVIDTGCGIPPAVRDELFAPFITSKSGGMGVGLAISHAIIEAHRGAIWAEPNPGGGTIFSFKLPLAGTHCEQP